MSQVSTSANIVARRSSGLTAEMQAQSDSTATVSPNDLLTFPPEILLHILSYLDIPDLAMIARVVPALEPLANDPVLQRYRLLIVSPSRVNHNLFGKGPHGQALRPTVPDLVHRGVLRGIERQWRMGAYFYSKSAVIQYENGRMLSRRLASNTLSSQLRKRIKSDAKASGSSGSARSSDGESFSPNVASSLLPIMRQLKWSLQRDRLAKVFKDSGMRLGVGAWLANGDIGRRILLDDEKFRLALCPDIRKTRGFFEKLSKT
ncbi:hypothetical protein BDN70DRAFT_870138 [Pholiota conissans]|uniref:F-box domain-containing protein n=1 Tax=Pholiota conissans TaxID=109636 RepID=A0A9P5ZG84_9AGAR|nr:hypothetical protein BDN70DRAFT_870138 [Pholiota conissans]